MLVIDGSDQDGSSTLIVSTDGAIIAEEHVDVVPHAATDTGTSLPHPACALSQGDILKCVCCL